MKTFYHFLGNNLIAGITNYTVWFAITFFAYLQTNSVFATSLISGLYLVVTAASGFWLGSFVDHYPKKTMMMLSSTISLVAYILSFVVYITADPEAFKYVGSITLWVFIPLIMVGVIVGNIRNIALPVLVAFVVPAEKRDRANGLVGTTSGIAFMVTSIISGLLVGHSGMYWVLILSIIVTAGCLVHLGFLTVKEKLEARSQDESKKLDISGTIKVIASVPGLFPLIFFTMFNNFLSGVFMSLMDAYGLSLVSVQVWGLLWGVLSIAFIAGGLVIAKFGLGKNPLRAMFMANFIVWSICSVFTIYPSIVPLVIGMFIFLCVSPFIEAAEHTIVQKVVPPERLGRVFGFATSVEQAASPLTAFAIGPIAQFWAIPFMTTGAGVGLIGDWFGTGPARGIALVFTLAGLLGLGLTGLMRTSKYYHQLSKRYLQG